MKYIMFAKVHKGIVHYVPVIFPTLFVHSDMAENLLNGVLNEYVVHSAGEVSSFDIDGVSGESTTLGVAVDPLDNNRIKLNDYGGGYE